MSRILNYIVFVCIGIVVIASPLALGCVLPWGYGVLACLAYTALAAAVLRCIITRSVHRLFTPLAVVLFLGFTLILLQYIPWSTGLVKSLDPSLAEFYLQSAKFDPDPSYADSLTRLPLSLYRHATGRALLCFSIYLSLYLATVASVRSERDMSRCAMGVVIGGFVASMLGILQRVSGTKAMFWMVDPEDTSAFFGPYGSRNHFATYAGICLFTGIGLILARHNLVDSASSKWRDNIRQDIVKKRQQNFVTAFLVAVTAAAVIFSLSRMGVLSMALGGLVTLGVLALSGYGRRAVYLGLAAVLVVGGIVCYLGWGPIMDRLGATNKQIMVDKLADQRWAMFQDAVRMGREHIWTGTGAGTFLSVYPYYRTIPGDVVAQSPHNEYLHVFAELGLPGLILAVAGVLLVAARVAYALKVRRNPYAIGFLTGIAGVIVMVAVHACMDFPLRLPATAAVLAVVLGCTSRACVSTRRRKRGANEDTEDIFDEDERRLQPDDWGTSPEQRSIAEIQREVRARKSKRRHRNRGHLAATPSFIALLIVAVGWLWLCNLGLAPVRGHMELLQLSRAIPLVREDPDFEDIRAFVATTESTLSEGFPLDAKLWSGLAEVAKVGSDSLPDQIPKVALAEKAWQLRAVACRLEPLQVRHRIRMGADFIRLGAGVLGRGHMRYACGLRPGDPHVRITAAKYLVDAGQTDYAEQFLYEAEALAEKVPYRDSVVAMGRLEEALYEARLLIKAAQARSVPPGAPRED